jgi:Na+/proline symporter
MTSINVTRIGAAAIAGIAAIHLLLAPEYLGEQAYVGVLFLLGAGAGALIAVRLWRGGDPASWALGVAISVGMAIGFVLSRTIGLPGFHESEWELSGLISLLLEAGFVTMAIAALAVGPFQYRGELPSESRTGS